MCSSRTRSGSLLALALVLAATAARADEASDAADAFDRGIALFDDARYDEALGAFRQAHALRPHAAILLNVAVCLDRLGRPVDAVAAYLRYRHERGDRIEPARREVLEDGLARLEPQVAILRIDAPSSAVAITLDGVVVEPAGDLLVVAPGQHTISAELRDGATADQVVDVRAGSDREVRLDTAEPRPERDEPSSLDLRVTSAPDGRIAPLDDRFPSRRLSPTWRWVGVGVTTALAGALLYTALMARSLSVAYQESPTRGELDDGLFYRRATEYFLFPAALVSLGLTVTAFILSTPAHEQG